MSIKSSKPNDMLYGNEFHVAKIYKLNINT